MPEEDGRDGRDSSRTDQGAGESVRQVHLALQPRLLPEPHPEHLPRHQQRGRPRVPRGGGRVQERRQFGADPRRRRQRRHADLQGRGRDGPAVQLGLSPGPPGSGRGHSGPRHRRRLQGPAGAARGPGLGRQPGGAHSGQPDRHGDGEGPARAGGEVPEV